MYPLARKLNTYLKKAKFISHKQHLCGLIFLYFLRNEATRKHSNAAPAKKLFSSFYVFGVT